MNNSTETVNCPMCGTSEAVEVRTRGDIVRCNNCELVYLRTRPTVKELETHYQSYCSNPGSHMRLPRSKDEVLGSGLRRDNFLDHVVEYTGDTRKTLLDIGCGWGAFLHNAYSRGFKVLGVEICRLGAEFANRRLGIKVYDTQLEQCPIESASIQVVTMLHSLEHLPNQRTALEFAHRILEPNGYLMGIVPNFASFCSQKMGDDWEWLDPTMHEVHFTPETLTRALWSCGFNLLRAYTATGDFSRHIIQQQLAKHPVVCSIDDLERTNQGEELRFFSQKI